MKEIRINDENYIKFSETPWNTKAFGFSVYEIKQFVYSDEFMLDNLLNFYIEAENDFSVDCSITRIDSINILLKRKLQNKNFYYAETSFDITVKNLKKFTENSKIRGGLNLSVPVENDFSEIKKIASDDFHFGRFHEDSNFPIDKTRMKYANWIDEMVSGSEQFLVYKDEVGVASFLAYRQNESFVDLLLAGSRAGKGATSFYFWASFMEHFEALGVKEIYTNISAANTGIMNLYMALGFKFSKCLQGFHKMNKVQL